MPERCMLPSLHRTLFVAVAICILILVPACNATSAPTTLAPPLPPAVNVSRCGDFLSCTACTNAFTGGERCQWEQDPETEMWNCTSHDLDGVIATALAFGSDIIVRYSNQCPVCHAPGESTIGYSGLYVGTVVMLGLVNVICFMLVRARIRRMISMESLLRVNYCICFIFGDCWSMLMVYRNFGAVMFYADDYQSMPACVVPDPPASGAPVTFAEGERCTLPNQISGHLVPIAMMIVYLGVYLGSLYGRWMQVEGKTKYHRDTNKKRRDWVRDVLVSVLKDKVQTLTLLAHSAAFGLVTMLPVNGWCFYPNDINLTPIMTYLHLTATVFIGLLAGTIMFFCNVEFKHVRKAQWRSMPYNTFYDYASGAMVMVYFGGGIISGLYLFGAQLAGRPAHGVMQGITFIMFPFIVNLNVSFWAQFFMRLDDAKLDIPLDADETESDDELEEEEYEEPLLVVATSADTATEEKKEKKSKREPMRMGIGMSRLKAEERAREKLEKERKKKQQKAEERAGRSRARSQIGNRPRSGTQRRREDERAAVEAAELAALQYGLGRGESNRNRREEQVYGDDDDIL